MTTLTTERPPSDKPQGGARRWLALALLCVASFMVILDANIVTVALPSIGRDLHFAGSSIQWVVTAYAVTFGGLLLLGGRVADLYGRRRVFLAGVAVFAAASLLCGLAGSGAMLVAARALQGVAAAVMTPTALSIVLTIFAEGPDRNRAIGVWGATAGTGATAGGLLGGPLTDGLGWAWVFFINVPTGAAILALGPVLLAESRAGRGRRTLDVTGALTVTGAVVLLVYAVSTAPEAGWLSVHTAGVLAASAGLLVTFVVVERRSAAPLVPLRVFRSVSLVNGNLVNLLAGMAAFGQGFVLTQYAQQVLGWSAVRFGILTAVMPALAVVGSLVGQRVVTRTGYRPVAAVSMVLLGSGCLLLTGITVQSTYLTGVLPGLLLFGPGLGACTVAASIAAVTGVAPAEHGLASGLTNMSFQLGGALGVAVLATVTAAVAAPAGGGPAALTTGYGTSFAVAAGFAAAGLLCAVAVRGRQ